MFDIKQLDNAYDPQEQLLIALGVHPDQKEALDNIVKASQGDSSGLAPKPDTASTTPATSGVMARQPEQPAAPMATASQAAPMAPIARPNGAKPVMLPEQRLAQDQAELDRLNSTGSGISHIKNPVLRTIARIGDIAGTTFFPGITSQIPGTEAHHRDLVEIQEGRVANDLGVQQKQATIAHQKLENDALENKPAATPKPLFDQAGDLIGFQAGENLLGPNSPHLTPDMRDMMAAAKGKAPKNSTPEMEAYAEMVKGDPEHGVAPMSHADAYRKLLEMKGENKTTPVDQQELADFLKNPPHGYKGTPTEYARWKATLAPQAQVVISNAAAGGLKDAALDNAAEKYWSQGVLPAGGRGPAVMAQNQKIMNRAAELHSGESIVEGSAAYKANLDSLKKLQTNFDQVTAFENTAGKNLDVFLKTAKNVVDSGVPLINQPLRTVTGKVGGTDQIAFDTARTTALTEIAKVLNSSNASGVLSDSARHEVEGLIGKDATLAQIYSAANILKQDMANRHESYAAQIKDIQGRMPNKNTSSGGGAKKEAHPEEKKYPGFVVDPGM
jgi:hypothetical protein